MATWPGVSALRASSRPSSDKGSKGKMVAVPSSRLARPAAVPDSLPAIVPCQQYDPQ